MDCCVRAQEQMDGEDIEARAAIHDATRVTVHYLDVFHAVLFPSCSPQFLFSLYLAGRRLDGVHETRAIYRSRNGTSQSGGRPGFHAFSCVSKD